MPAAAAVNIVENEDSSRMYEEVEQIHECIAAALQILFTAWFCEAKYFAMQGAKHICFGV
jgi:hypothetical protein